MSDLNVLARQVLSLMDLTSLGEQDTPSMIASLCQKAQNPAGCVAAVCVYPRFVAQAKAVLLKQGASIVRVATVTNFPEGGADIASAVAQTAAAIAAGADEVDVVFPYRALLAGQTTVGEQLVSACKAVCQDKTLKVILETGELQQAALIRQASLIAIQAGADFIKTSTGKVTVNATLGAAEVMLATISESGGMCGFKAAGGVRTLTEAAAYIALAERYLGGDWLSPQHFRLGASALLEDVLQHIKW